MPQSTPENVPASPRERWRALLIGINRYRHVGDLDGAVNDVKRVRHFLEDHIGVPAENITALVDEQATRAAMIEALLELGRRDDLQPGDQVLVHYSGHGANMRDPRPGSKTPSGYIESLVAHDSGRGGEYNIPDYIFGALLRRIGEKAHLTVVLDCCHSGSGTRREERSRQCDPDERMPEKLDAATIDALEERGPAFPDGDLPYTVLAACRDRERALEHSQEVGDAQQSNGVFTTCLYDAFGRVAAGLSYGRLMERVGPEVTARSQYQHPNVDGNPDRIVFGGADVRYDAFVTVRAVTVNSVTLGAGLLHGLTRDTTLAVYPSDTQTRAEVKGTEPLAYVQVTRAHATTARAVILPDENGVEPDPATLQAGQALQLDPPKDGVRVRFDRLEGAQRPPLPAEMLWNEARPDEVPDITVELGPETARILDRGGSDRVKPAPTGPWIWDALDRMARFDRLARLKNPDRESKLEQRFALEVRRWLSEARRPEETPLETTDGRLILAYDPLDPQEYVVEVVSESPIAAEVHLLMLSADFSIGRLYPRASDQQTLSPKRSLMVGVTTRKERLKVRLPDDPLWVRSDNLLLLIAACKPMALDVLLQGGLSGALPQKLRDADPNPLEALLSNFAQGRRMLYACEAEDWGVSRLPITVFRKPAFKRVYSNRPQRLPIGLSLRAAAAEVQASAAALDRHLACAPKSVPRPPLDRLLVEKRLAMPSPAVGSGDSPLVLRVQGHADPGATLTVKLPAPVENVQPLGFDAADFTALGEAQSGSTLVIELPPGALDLPILFARPA